jgi:serine/threonine protein kinase
MPELNEQPRTLGRYELLYVLGQGGMGEVHLARTTGVAGFEKLYIVKTILPQVKADPQFVERFQHEAKLVTHLTHASIAQVYDMGETDGTMYMAIEYVPGVDLARVQDRVRANQAQIPIPVALYICRQMLEALGYAHRKPGTDGKSMGIVHRDVSPQNVMVSYEGEVKVIDFGLAKSAARSKATLPSTVLGKLGYMAPEQALAKEVDARGDIFSAGIVAWELLTGRPLYEGGTLPETMARMANPKIPSIRALRDEVSEGVESAVMRALQVDPNDRYARADEFARVLNEYMVKENLTINAEDVGNYVRTMCPEEFAAERKLRSKLSSAQKKKSGLLSSPSLNRGITQAGEYGQTLMRGSGDMTPAQRALSQADGPPPPPSRVPTQPPMALPGPRASNENLSPLAAEPLQKKRPMALIIALLALVMAGGGAGAAMYLMRQPPPEPPKPVEPVKVAEPVKPEEPVKPAEPVKPEVKEPEAPKEPVALGRVEAKKPLKVIRDKGELWVKLDKPRKVSVGDTFKVVGPALTDNKKSEREWFAEGTVMEKEGSLARLSVEPADAVLPPDKELFAVVAAKEANLKTRVREQRDRGVKPEKKDEGTAGQPKEGEKPKDGTVVTAGTEKPVAVDAGTAAASDNKPTQLHGKMTEAAWGRVELTNNDDFTWTECRVWYQPDLDHPNRSYKFPSTWKLEAGAHDTVQLKEFEEDPNPPRGWNKNYPLLKCKEGAAHLALR